MIGQIVSLTGNMGCGKTTIAEFLVREYDFIRLSHAAPLKRIAGELFDLTNDDLYTQEGKKREHRRDSILECIKRYSKDEISEAAVSRAHHVVSELPETVTSRLLLQLFGTEIIRHVYGDDFWVNKTIDSIYDSGSRDDSVFVLDDYKNFVIDDTRFVNEIGRLREEFGVDEYSPLISIGVLRSQEFPNPEGLHASEAEMIHNWSKMTDVTIINDDSLDSLYRKLNLILS